MSEAQAEWAVQSLYENPGCRDELTDSEAMTLLRWAEAQITRLAGMELPDETFEAAYDHLIGLTRYVNRLAAWRARLPQEDQEVALNRIAERAAAVGLTIPPDRLTDFLDQPASEDIHDNVRALIALVMSGADSEGHEGHYDEETQQ